MGKKSLIKSTSKKKPAAKKAAAKTTKKKKTPAKKVAQKSTSKSKTKKKAVAKKISPKLKAISKKDLLTKKFDTQSAKILYTIPEELKEKSTFTAPEFLAGVSTDDAKRIKGLLANTYSSAELKAVARAPVPKAKPVSVEELLRKKFDIVKPEVLYTVPEEFSEKSTFTAPEFLTSVSTDDVKRIKGLLANTYSEGDLKAAAEKAAAEKAAAEKAAAEKAAAEKAAAEKAAAEKAAAEKAAAEKAAAEKAAAEKAAAEKAAAEKAAAEKAAAEKAAVEKAAAEKAAAEKAAAEKAAVEKAAAEKAAAEKAAAEKAAAEKAAAEKPPSDPIDTSIKLFAAGLAFLLLLVVWASTSNSLKYYAIEKDGALEIWKGKFAPLGKKIVVVLPGYQPSGEIKETYRSHEVLSMAFEYYVDKADVLMDVPGIPDFEEIKANLKIALSYAPNREKRSAVYDRLDNIDRLILMYKAETAAIRGTTSGLTAAIGFLKEARKLSADKAQKESIALTIEGYEAALAALEKEKEAAGQEQATTDTAAQQAEKTEVEEETVTHEANPDNAVPPEEAPASNAEHQ